ncbi:hemerythrin domain-containing protein [Streptomyces marincola]|uniref:hemerythrin domain-containing protein n=1 Tax=Streptomyces marincola TaxID=2878388 RepID=UPI001CF25E98|nr:hemerythrin domain-containing protein [Streptomyces marincola]UCM89675.1 hemerythrin domain-containing protein [Streptomyces marincola]
MRERSKKAMDGSLDMTAMYAMHDALRRDLRHVAHITSRADRDPGEALRAAEGWDLLKHGLHVHHRAEDDALWPALRGNLAGRPGDLALLEAMEAEHAALAPLVEALDHALSDSGAPQQLPGDLADSIVTGLTGHLAHEEEAALPLVQEAVTQKQWAHFCQVHAEMIHSSAPRLLPWLLDGADEHTVTRTLASLPRPERQAYEHQWLPAYAELDPWGATRAP